MFEGLQRPIKGDKTILHRAPQKPQILDFISNAKVGNLFFISIDVVYRPKGNTGYTCSSKDQVS